MDPDDTDEGTSDAREAAHDRGSPPAESDRPRAGSATGQWNQRTPRDLGWGRSSDVGQGSMPDQADDDGRGELDP